MRYHLITYGCQMNERDSEALTGLLKDRGFAIVEDAGKADIVLLVLDASVPIDQFDGVLLKSLSRNNVVLVLNKIDLLANEEKGLGPLREELMDRFDVNPDSAVRISATRGWGLDQLLSVIGVTLESRTR